jgi:hypothetical protein
MPGPLRERDPAVNVACARRSAGREAIPPRPAGPDSFGAALRRGLSRADAGRTQRGPRDAQLPEPAPEGDARPLLAAMLSDPERAPTLAAPASIHRVALALEVLRAGDRSRIEIGLQGGVALQLNAVSDGVAMVLNVTPPLERVAAAELPALVEALRRRGVKVARAEVRVGPERRGGGGRSR